MKNKSLILFSLILFLLITFMILLPGIAARYLTDNSRELTGRYFKVDDIDINYITGVVDIHEFIMYEQNERDTFISFHELSLNIGIVQTILGTPTIDEFHFISPYINIEQDSTGFNFKDIIVFFDSTSTKNVKNDASEPMDYVIRNIKLQGGEIDYTLKGINSTIGFQKIQAECREVNSQIPDIDLSTSFDFLHGGKSNLDVHLDLDAATFSAHSSVDRLNLRFMESIFMGIMNVTALSGYASSELNISGNYINTKVINTSGTITVDDFDLRGPDGVKTVYFGSYEMKIDTAEIGNALFDIEYMKLDSFYTLFELYENDNNFDRLLGLSITEKSDTIDSTGTVKEVKLKSGGLDDNTVYMIIAKSIMDYFRGYSISQYSIGDVEMTRSAVTFRDHTLHDEFEYRVTNMKIRSKGINSNADSIGVKADCILNETGKLVAECYLDPENYQDLQLNYTVSDLKIYDFSPHSRHYVAYPILDGKMVFKCDLTIENGIIKNYNYVQIDDFDFGKKDDIDPVYKLPVKLAASLLKNNKGVINLEVPVTGDLNDPDFHFWNVILNVFRNIIMKAAEAPYRLVAGFFEKDEDAAENIYLSFGSGELQKGYGKSVRGIHGLCEKKPDINFDLILLTDSMNDIRSLALQIMKASFLEQDTMNSVRSDKGSDKVDSTDSTFVSFVNARTSTVSSGRSIEEKCLSAINEQELVSAFRSLNQQRKDNLHKALIEAGVPASRFIIYTADPSQSNGHPGLPKFLISYVTEQSTETTVKTGK